MANVIVAPDAAGLVCGFQLAPIAPLAGEYRADGPHWLHLNLADSRAQRWLEQKSGLPAEARALLLGSDPRIHAELAPGAVMAVLGDLHHDFRGDPENFGSLRLYADGERLITARRHPLMTPDRLRRQLSRGEVELPSAAAALEQLFRCLGDTFAHEVETLSRESEDAEDSILAGHYHEQGPTLGRIRRLLVRLRRHLNGNRAVLQVLSARLPGLRAAGERLEAVAQDLELVQERARLLQEEIAGRAGQETNRNLFWLSIMTTTMLPITLITGVFGMNVGGLPFLDDRAGFWLVMGLIGSACGGILWILRKRKVL